MRPPPKFTNKLIGETSPYLLQHAHNPVDWYPWGDEAFEKARAEDKPVLVSIGYSACHWCHVMEHESFEDEKIAMIQNEHFVNIKVDMEERPDVDQIYMNFVQLTTGRGGWPMNVFLTPGKLPFFGGTYFPPSPRFNMPSWPQVLLSIAEAWSEKRDELFHSANEILGELRRLTITGFSPAPLDQAISENAYKSLVRSFDAVNGGFGGAPKFPAAMSMEFLLRYWRRTGDRGAIEIVIKTAEEMAKGGIYDQLGGGFHRYAVDAIWLVPHFEKMLYDNAQLIRVYLHLYQICRAEGDSRADFFRRIAVETLDYVRREMTDASGAFFSTQDADSEGHEGKFFVWTADEIAEILGADEAAAFSAIFDVTPSGNFEGKNILNLRGGSGAADERIARWKQKLFQHREQRVKPFRDEKVLTAWNGLMLSAFAEASAVLECPEYLDVARNNADFLLANMVQDGDRLRLFRAWKDGAAKLNGYIEDYADLADALIDFFQVSGEQKYLFAARDLADAMISGFWDEENGGFFFTSNTHEELIVRNKDLFDNATPSGNSVAAGVLLKLAKFFADDRYEKFGITVLRLGAPQIRRYPSGFGRMLSNVEFALSPVKEIAIIGEKGNDLERELWSAYRPFIVLAPSAADDQAPRAASPHGGKASSRSEDDNSDGEAVIPLLEDRPSIDGGPTAYVCQNFICERPTADVSVLKDLLDTPAAGH